MANGGDLWGIWTFFEIVPLKKLVTINGFSDAQGGLARTPFGGEWPLETLSTTTFAAEGNGTRLTLRWAPRNATEAETKAFMGAFASMEQGWGGTFDRLTEFLAKG